MTATELRRDNLVVALTTDAYAYNDEQYTLEVISMAGDEFLENDADMSGLPVDASEAQVAAYLEAALTCALLRVGKGLRVVNVAGYAAAAGVAAARAVAAATDSSAPPKFCPYCGGTEVREVAEWEATSADDPENVANVQEYQCQGACQGRSFWS